MNENLKLRNTDSLTSKKYNLIKSLLKEEAYGAMVLKYGMPYPTM